MLPKMNKQVADVVEIPDSDEEDDGPTGSGRTNAPPGGAPLSPVLSRETLGTRSFWKAGNFAVAPTAKFDLAGDSLEHARVHPKFLHSNATSHKWAFGAIAELLDNAVDEIHHGATFVKVDKVDIMKDKSPALLFQDDGGGMDPEAIRKCMSLGYSSKKSNTTIGQYGNGFKTSTMRLGADVIVFSRATHASKATQSVGLLSYTFLRRTGQDDVIVPMIDFDISKGWVDPITYGSQDDWLSDLNTILEWSPFSSKEELMEQFEDIGSHGTKVIIYNLWLNDEGVYELSFDDDEEDIRLRDEANSGETRLSKKALEVQSHISYRIHFSLQAYASVLYLRKFENFQIIIRGKPVMQFHIADELKYTAVVKYKPQLASGSKELTVDTTIGFIKEAPALPVCGFNVYHKNRLIRSFWKVTAEGHSRGNGVVGVLEANFIEPAHNKQDFERSTLFIRLEARLKQMVMDYWRQHCHLVGYKPDRSMQHVLQKGTGQPHVVDPEDIQMQSVVSLPESMLQDTVTGQTGLDDGLYHGVTSDAQDSTFVDQICEENIKLFMRCEEYVREEEDLKQTVEKLERELHETKRRCALLNSILVPERKRRS